MSTINSTDYNVISWDTVTPVEWFTIVVVLLASVVLFVCGVIIIFKRNYPPLKAKQVPLVVICAFSGAILMLSTLSGNRVFPQEGVFLYHGGCDIFGLWLSSTLGLFPFIITIVFRLLRLYWIFVWRQNVSVIFMVSCYFLLFLYPLLFSIVGTALNANGPVINTENGFPTCTLLPSMQIPTYIFFVFLLLLFVFLTFSLRLIPKKAFNDHVENRNLFVFFIIVFVVTASLGETNSIHYVWGRVLSCLLGTLSVVVVFFVTTGNPLYHSLVDPDEYLKKFLHELNDVKQLGKFELKFSSTSPNESENTKLESPTMQTLNEDASNTELV